MYSSSYHDPAWNQNQRAHGQRYRSQTGPPAVQQQHQYQHPPPLPHHSSHPSLMMPAQPPPPVVYQNNPRPTSHYHPATGYNSYPAQQGHAFPPQHYPQEQPPPHMLHRSRTAPAPIPPRPDPPVPPHVSFYSYHPDMPQQHSHAPPNRPDVPPKLPLSLRPNPPPPLPPYAPPTDTSPSKQHDMEEPAAPSTPMDDHDLKAALALSEQESKLEAQRMQELTSQEDDELEKALRESMKVSSRTNYNQGNSFTSATEGTSPQIFMTSAGPSSTSTNPWERGRLPEKSQGLLSPDEKSSLPYLASRDPSPSPSTAGPSQANTPHSGNRFISDEAMARRLAAQEERTPSPPHSRDTAWKPPTPTNDPDEAYARKLAEEEQAEAEANRAEDAGPVPDSSPLPPEPSTAPPTYDDAMAPSTSSSAATSPRPMGIASLPTSPKAGPSEQVSSPPPLTRKGSGASTSTVHTVSSVVSNTNTPQTSSSDHSRPSHAGSVYSIPESSATSFSNHSSPPSESVAVPKVLPSAPKDRVIEEVRDGVPVNQYVDSGLLRGVSVGFTPPAISEQLEAMSGVMPNIISLPYGRCPPLHLQAPSWRHLLKMMAWLSGTRMEPTVEAMAHTKADALQLRTVIQFIKPHPMAAEWRTVLWFTIDHPVPPQLPGGRKYTMNDVDVLPWSYTLSNIPTLLQDGADSPISRTYTIPNTESLPYPPLPISFPNLALYLQAALVESRKFIGDSSSGFRKLAKMLDTCYPEPIDPGDILTNRERVGGLFKKVMGRGNKKKNGRSGNEDTYELVTPFVPDQWG